MSIKRNFNKVAKTVAGTASGAMYGTAIVAAAVVGNTIDTVKAIATAPITITTGAIVGGYSKEASWTGIAKKAREYKEKNS
jgi:hypothetical protein